MSALDISTEQTAAALADGTAVVVDVREPYEREAGHIPGSEHIVLGELTVRQDEVPRDRRVIFACRVGGRSAMAAQAFRAAGYDAWSMAGGMVDWAAEGRPMAPEGATVAAH